LPVSDRKGDRWTASRGLRSFRESSREEQNVRKRVFPKRRKERMVKRAKAAKGENRFRRNKSIGDKRISSRPGKRPNTTRQKATTLRNSLSRAED